MARLRSGALLAALIPAVVLLVAGTGWGGTVTHRVTGGESLSSIAGDFYGDRDHYRLLALYNGIADPGRLAVNTRLKLPYSDLVTIRQGQSLSLVAGKHLGEPGLYTVIARLNGLRAPETVAAGTRVRIPVLIPYSLHWGESLADIAKEYYGDVRYYDLIADASGITDPARVKAGTRLRLPFLLIRRSAATGSRARTPSKTVTARERPVSAPAPTGRSKKGFLERLGRAEAEYRRGEYEAARKTAAAALEGLAGADRARGLRLLADIAYAYGETAQVARYLEEAYRIEPGFTPQPAMYNPEMMEMHRRAK